MLTFVGATAAVAALEIVYVILAILKFDVPVVLRNVQAFSLNHNFFAFQLVMALAAAIVFLQQPKLRIGALVTILAAFWFAGSRSGWIAGVFVLAIGLYLRNLRVQELSIATLCLVLAAILALLPSISSQTSLMPQIIPSGASTQERLTSIVGGLDLFVHHPIFGAGLGAFRNKLIPGSGGSPLLIHSTAVWLLAELGILGFLVFAIPGLRVFFDQWRSAREPASALVVLCLVAFGAMSAPADMLYQRTFWLLMGAALALAGRDGHDRTEPFDLA